MAVTILSDKASDTEDVDNNIYLTEIVELLRAD